MNISKFTQKSIQAINNLEKVAYDFGNQEIEQEEESTIFAAPVEHNDRKVKTGGRWKKILAAFLAVAILAGGTFAIIKLIPVLDDGSSTSSGNVFE